MTDNLTIFNYNDNNKVRTFIIDNEPYFVVSDVCSILELTNSRMATSRLKKDDVTSTYIIDSMGRKQSITIANEKGLYDLVLQSRKPEAEKFKNWITHEILPSIRKTGKYEMPNKKLDKMEKILEGYTYALALIDEQKQLITSQQKQIEHDKPKVETFNKVIDSNGLYLVRQVAKMIGTGEHRLFSFLRKKQFISYSTLRERNEPYQKYVELGYFVLKLGTNKNDPKNRTHATLFITNKGIDFIRREWDKNNTELF
jgi:anti-repressor protein